MTDAEAARGSPELATVSALTRGGSHPHRHQVLTAFLAAVQALEAVDRDRADVYHEVVNAVLPAAARHCLERLMSTKTNQFRSDLAPRHLKIGRAEGRAEHVLLNTRPPPRSGTGRRRAGPADGVH